MSCSAVCSSHLGLQGQGRGVVYLGIIVSQSWPAHHPHNCAQSVCFPVIVGLVMRPWLWKGERLPLLGCSHPFWQTARHLRWTVKLKQLWRSSVNSCRPKSWREGTEARAKVEGTMEEGVPVRGRAQASQRQTAWSWVQSTQLSHCMPLKPFPIW